MAVRLAAFVPPDALVHALRPPRHAAEVLALPLDLPLAPSLSLSPSLALILTLALTRPPVSRLW